MRIYASTTDRIDNRPVYETIIFAAKKMGLAGATAYRGVMGFGAKIIVS